MDWIFGMGIQPRGSPRTRDRKCISAKKKKIWIMKIILFSSDVKKPRWHIIHFTTYRSTMRFML